MADVKLGTDLMLFLELKSGETKALACATSCKITLNANVLETSSKDSGYWTTKQASKLSWSCSSDNLFTLTNYNELMDVMIERKPVKIQFDSVAHNETEGEKNHEDYTPQNNGYVGEVIITSIDVNAPDGDNATYTVSMEGTGALKRVPTTE